MRLVGIIQMKQKSEEKKTNVAQVLSKQLTVSYHCYAIIRCSITKEKAKDIDEQLAVLTKHL